jgi:hypothetical protein
MGWIINSVASGHAIGSVLLQERDNGGFNIVSTALRVLNQTQQHYTTCKELLAIVYTGQRFRIYIYGHKGTLFANNTALSFLHRCIITFNRVARWMVQIQEYDLEIRHIKGVQNHLADILSHNPSGVTDEQTRDLTRPD